MMNEQKLARREVENLYAAQYTIPQGSIQSLRCSHVTLEYAPRDARY